MVERLDTRLREMPPGACHDLITKISEIDGFRGRWQGREPPDRSILERLKKHAVETSARASADIEQPPGERPVPRTRRGSPEDRESRQRMAYAELLQAVFDDYEEMPFGEEIVLECHTRLLRYSAREQAHRGAYRTTADDDTRGAASRRGLESIALRPAAPDLAPQDMREAIRWTATRLASSEFHPLLVVAGFVLEFLAIRPFVTGNGHMSRILTNLLLLQKGYTYVPYASLEKVIANRRTEYYLALRRSQASRNVPHPDITPWLSAFLDAMCTQIGELRAMIDVRVDVSLLSRNQLSVLDLLERNGEVTNRLVRRELGIPKETAKQALNRLLALDMVRRAGRGRAVRYRKAPPPGDACGAR